MTTRNRELASIIDASGNITAGGNLTVSGTTTTISSTVQTMADNLIELNTGASSNSNDLGLVMERGSTGDNALFIWDESNDGFVVGTTTATGTSTGNISFSAAPFTASTITGTVLTGSTSVKTPLIEYTDGDDAITIADGGHITTGGNLSIGGSNNELRFYEGANYVGFEAPALSADKIWVLPAADGTTGQLLKTDGSGNLSFTDDLTLASADVNNYTGNGSTTAFTLSTTPTLETAIQAYVDGVYQFKNTFSFSGTTFTFDTAPDNGALIEILVWNTVAVNVPAASSVTNTTLNASIITGQTEATAVDADHVLIYDASATALRKALVSDLVQTDEEIADIIGAMFSSNTETGITATYQDADNTIDLVIGDDVIVQSMIADNAIDSQHYVDGSIDTAHIADDSVTLAKMAGIARGKIIYGDASGNPAVLTVGSNGQVLKSDGTDIAWATDATVAALTSEEVQDIAGAMFSSNTETGITATYQDADGTIDLVVGTLNQNTTGSAATLTTARTIGGVSFDGSANINLPGVNSAGNQNVDAALVDGENFKINGGQGTDGQLLTSTGAGVAWEDAPAGGPTFKTFGTSSFMVGDDATGTIDAADYNVGVGIDVFAALTSGDDNVAVGFAAAAALTTGVRNVFIGEEAGSVGTSTSYSVGIGRESLKNATGNNNTAVGYVALKGLTSGAENVAVGRSAMTGVVTGTSNVAVGYGAGAAITSGGYNTFLGRNAGDSVTTGSSNVAIGINAMHTLTASSYPNIGIGENALHSLASGTGQNTAIGYRSGEGSTTCEGVTLLGSYTGLANQTGNNLVAIGNAAAYAHTGGNSVAIGQGAMSTATSTDDSVFIGPGAGLDFTTGHTMVMIGDRCGENHTTSTAGTFVGYKAGRGGANADTTQCTFIGSAAGANHGGGNCTFVGAGSGGNGNNDNGANVFGSAVTGGAAGGYFTVGYGSTKGWYQHGASAGFSGSSDRRMKENIVDSTLGLSFINDLKPVTYDWKKKKDIDTSFDSYEEGSEERYVPQNGTDRLGFIAQDVKEALNKANVPSHLWTESKDGSQALSLTELIPTLVKAIQELSAKVEELENGE